MDASKLYIGLLSGTSVDAIDVALVDFSGSFPVLIATHTHTIPNSLKQTLHNLTQTQANELHLTMQADAALGTLFGEAILALLAKTKVSPSAICAIGSHGQTIRHRPDDTVPYTLQIGDPNRIAAVTGIVTVADFRRQDLAYGGQGAPLAPAFHAEIFRSNEETRAVVNIGGFSNITLIPKDPKQQVIGFDTGPGNALLDLWCQRCINQPYDESGNWASKGTLVPELFGAFIADPFLTKVGPKSTGKDFFNANWIDDHLARLSSSPRAQDVQYTLTEFTAHTIAQKALEYKDIGRIYICGGGAHNTFLLSRLAALCSPRAIHTTIELGIAPDWVEAVLFAWLAKQRIEGNSLHLNSVTGSSRPVLLGGVYSPSM